MDAKEQEGLKRQLRAHLRTVLVLAAVVALNVAVSFLPLERSVRTAVQVGLALVGAGIVLTVFMHLLTEKQSTLVILACTGVLFAVLMVLPLFAAHSHPALTEIHGQSAAATNQPAHHVP